MEKAKLLRLVEDSPDGPCLVIELRGREFLLPVSQVTELLAKNDYVIVEPFRFEIETNSADVIGPLTISEKGFTIDTKELATPHGRRAFASAMMAVPILRKILGVTRRPDGTYEFNPPKELSDEDFEGLGEGDLED